MRGILFPSLGSWEPTRDTLHFYAKSIGVIPRALAAPHAKWWHVSLKIEETGAATDRIPISGSYGASFQVLMNFLDHTVDIKTSDGISKSLRMTEGLSSTAFGDQLISAVRDLGVDAKFERSKFENDEPREYDPEAATRYLSVLQAASRVLKDHRSTLDGETSPVQLWPHNFDLAFEWFGSLNMPRNDGSELPAQINFGLAPGDSSHPEAYFYSNPWPFQESLLEEALPSGARWFTESWKGTLLPYASIANKESASEHIAAYFKAVYDLASPLLIDS